MFTQITDLEAPEQRAKLDSAIELSDALDHLPSMVLTRLMKADHALKSGAQGVLPLLLPAVRALEEGDENALQKMREALETDPKKIREMVSGE
jgi:hypothetical protein